MRTRLSASIGVCFIVTTGLLTGCATTAEQNNPAQGGFWNGVTGVVGGQYDERIEQQEEQLAQEQERTRRLEERKLELEQEASDIEQEIGLTRERIARLDESISYAIEELADAEGERRNRKMELEIAQSRLDEFMEVLDSPDSTSEAQVASINQSLNDFQALVEGS